MKHTHKTLLFKSLEILPNRLGFATYHWIQKAFDRSSLESKIKKSETTTKRLSEVCNELHIDLKDKTILEIGSGWYPIMPYFLLFRCQAKKVFTFDINQHYQKKAIALFNATFSKMYDYKLEIEDNNPFHLPSAVAYSPSKDVTQIALPQADIIFSRYVLSHASEDAVYKMHQKFKSDFPKGTYVIHFISPSDLRQHGDKSISMQDFLQYSKAEWNKIMTKFDSHNRLRFPQFIEMFQSLDYEILFTSYDSVDPNSPNYKLFMELNLHEDYKKYTTEELTAGNILVVMKT